MTAFPSAQTDRFVHERLPTPALSPQLRYDLPQLHIAEQTNLVASLMARAAHEGWLHRPCLRSDGLTLSYAQVQHRVSQIAQLLVQDLGLVPGNRVLLRGGNSMGMALAWLGVVQAGLIAVATMPLLRAKELREVMSKAQPQLALCDGALRAELDAATEGRLRTVAFNLPHDAQSLEALASAQDGQLPPCGLRADFGDGRRMKTGIDAFTWNFPRRAVRALVRLRGATGVPRA
jgi:2-aminobenzoate-CoA ligase